MKTVRLVSAMLLFGAAACGGDITGGDPRGPSTAHDGPGWLGGGGYACSTCAPARQAPGAPALGR
jgi:hypothetical protein